MALDPEDLIREHDKLKGDRGTWESHWQQLADYVIPNRADYIVERTPGAKRMQKVFDSTPIWACEQLSAGLHSLLTSQTLRWFSLAAIDERVNELAPVKAWLDDASERMYRVFNSPQRGFAPQCHELYLDLGSVGTSVMSIEESDKLGVHFATRHLRECVIDESDLGKVDTLHRRFKLSAKQAVQKWGTAAGDKVLEAFDKDPHRPLEFQHSVKPRVERDPARRDARHKPWLSAYVALEGKSLISESGFDEFPYCVPRWGKAAGELYGRGPGMIALPDIKQLNEMVKTIIKAAQKIVDPPLMVPDDGFLVPIRTLPGGLNYYRAGTTDRVMPIETKGNVQLGIELLGQQRQQIIRTFYVEWLVMPSDLHDPAASGKGVTATYVLQQRDEKMRLLSPILARLQSEFLGPLIDRVFAIMWRRGAFPPAPPELSGMPLKVEYVSPIAIAQQSSETEAMQRWLQEVLQLAQFDPDAALLVDGEQAGRLSARLLNAPGIIVRSPQMVAALRQARAAAQQQAAQHAALANVAGAAKDGSAAVANLADAGRPAQAAA